MTEVEDVTRRRMKALQQSNPHLSFEDDHMDTDEGVRGLIRIIDGKGDIIGLEFVEPLGFWMDPDAIDEYRETMEEGFHVTVIVPTEEKGSAEGVIHEEVGGEVNIIGYDELSGPLGFEHR